MTKFQLCLFWKWHRVPQLLFNFELNFCKTFPLSIVKLKEFFGKMYHFKNGCLKKYYFFFYLLRQKLNFIFWKYFRQDLLLGTRWGAFSPGLNSFYSFHWPFPSANAREGRAHTNNLLIYQKQIWPPLKPLIDPPKSPKSGNTPMTQCGKMTL